ncbi:MAG TPA: aminomethyl-transferring glycine dehydrogenase subunit GcvPB [Anaerolineae bacterium]|nr:aminomethyl-transferring glycine dehydrogenase subunit GcvPB [Anaerolineae bacterium]HQI86519.1 aminomethyl-transferring glycine dehydrogenase subunit GcvPB [Anaerolineae bacterium]
MSEPLIYELSSPGRAGVKPPHLDVPESALPANLLREDLPLPEVSEVDVVRHYLRLSQLNYAIDKGMYPLGSCTMKFNPKVNEVAARLAGFTGVHPLQDEESVQGALYVMYSVQEYLKEIGGFAAMSLQPAAGAHGELTGVLIMRKYHLDHGDTDRDTILVPDSAHGTNPASTSMSGLRVVEIPSDARGNIDLDALRAQVCARVVGLMFTNPNTLGLFEEHTEEVINIVHGCGGLVYGDGANMNALTGIMRPGDAGIDVMHFNLHKTFSTPHGGGGPGSGPVGVAAHLADYLPGPIVALDPESTADEDPYFTFFDPPKSIGRVKAFWGQFGVIVRAYTYIRMLGSEGVRKAAEHAVLNANYLLSRIKGAYPLPYDRICKHEFVVEGHLKDAPDVHALDIAKRLIDYGVHPPTNYFPLIVPEALMIEPTETESKQSLDNYADILLTIAAEARETPELLHAAPHNAPVRRLDEVRAARNPVLRYAH